MSGASLVKRKKPIRKTVRLIRRAVQLRLEENMQTWEQVCDWLNAHGHSITEHTLVIYLTRYPDVYNAAIKATMAKMGEEASRAVAHQRIKSFVKAAGMAEKADKRLETILDDDEVSPAVHVDAIKHVHSTLGMGQKGESIVSGSFSPPSGYTERGKELLAAFGFGVLAASGEKLPPIEAEVEIEGHVGGVGEGIQSVFDGGTEQSSEATQDNESTK